MKSIIRLSYQLQDWDEKTKGKKLDKSKIKKLLEKVLKEYQPYEFNRDPNDVNEGMNMTQVDFEGISKTDPTFTEKTFIGDVWP